MSFGYNRINYGIHSICPLNASTHLPYGILKVIGGGTLNMTSEFEELFGGSSKVAWAVEAKTISTEWKATVKTLNDFQFQLFLGATVSTTAASATGTVGDFADVYGGSVLAATTGIASVSAISGSEANLKDGIYIIKAVSATTVDIYACTDIEFKKLGGTAASYQDENLKINASAYTITATADTNITELGVKMTGGSGTIGMTIGDTARFSVRSPHAGISTIDIGSSSTIFPEHRQICLGQKRANGDTFEIEMYKVVGSGMPVPFEEQAFAIPEMNMKLIYDSTLDKVATIRAKRGV